MVGRVKTAAVTGICAEIVEVEADMAPGIPSFELTGNLGNTAREGKDRVRTALRNSDILLHPARYTINLAPANVRKDGPHFDLAIAIALLQIIGLIPAESTENVFFAGELSLDGKVNSINAVLPMVSCARDSGCKRCIVPLGNAEEGSHVEGIEIYGVSTLGECIRFLTGIIDIEPTKNSLKPEGKILYAQDFGEVNGQTSIKRAAMIAAASMHNLFMIGPPGAGKTMVASRIPSILPILSDEECMAISKVYSVAGLLRGEQNFITTRPFRAPHHLCTPTSLTGGGRLPIPGEMSLADHGVLFLDELNLFNTSTIEALRQPLERGSVTVSRLNATVEYPAQFMLVAAMNPCKCGFYPDRARCNCTPADIKQYYGKISRPILDRFDVCIHVPKATYEEVSQTNIKHDEIDSAKMRNKVSQVYAIQDIRYKGEAFHLNSQIPSSKIKKYCVLSSEANKLLETAYGKYDLSARGYYRILRVARTIADLEQCETIREEHIAEAIGYKMI